MRGLRAEFYADDADVQSVLEKISEFDVYMCIEMNGQLNSALKVFEDPKEIFADMKTDRQFPRLRPAYLLIEKETEIVKDKTKMADGSGVKESSDQVLMPDSVVIRFGGNAGDDTLTMSQFATLGETNRSREIHKIVKRIITTNAKRVGPKGDPHLLMSGAIAKLKAGWRLVGAKNMPAMMDVKIPAEQIAAL
ncbi:MAG: hypothetical protein AAF224_08480 [Pseudomonadota bacterium]